MDYSGDFESISSFLGHNLAPVAPHKVSEEIRFWRDLMHFDTFTKKSKISKEFRLKREASGILSYEVPRVFKMSEICHAFSLESNTIVKKLLKCPKNTSFQE